MGNPVVVPFNASVTNNILEIRFYWAGKGTTRFPRRGVYGPLISAVSVEPCKYSHIFIFIFSFCINQHFAGYNAYFWFLTSIVICINSLWADFKTCSAGGKKKTLAYVGIAVGASCFVLLVLAVILWKRSLRHNKRKDKGMKTPLVSVQKTKQNACENNISA